MSTAAPPIVSYDKMYKAYWRIFERCGLNFRAVEADTGTIGGSSSHEFMVLADSGEDAIVSCSACGYAANVEKAEAAAVRAAPAACRTPPAGAGRDAGQADHRRGLRVPRRDRRKRGEDPDLLADNEPVVALLRGDHELNEIKLKNLLGCDRRSRWRATTWCERYRRAGRLRRSGRDSKAADRGRPGRQGDAATSSPAPTKRTST